MFLHLVSRIRPLDAHPGWDQGVVRKHYVCVVFALNRSFFSTTSVHPVSALILHPREIQALWSQNYDTGSYHTLYQVDSSSTMPCHCAGLHV